MIDGFRPKVQPDCTIGRRAHIIEAAALDAYRRWDAEAAQDERAALDALATHDDQSWVAR